MGDVMFIENGFETRYFGKKVRDPGAFAVIVSELEILWSIIYLIAIDMVNKFVSLEWSTKTKSNYKTMFKDSRGANTILLGHCQSNSLLVFGKSCYDKCYITLTGWLSRIALLVARSCGTWWTKSVPTLSAKSCKTHLFSYRSPNSGWRNIPFLSTTPTDDCNIVGSANLGSVIPKDDRIINKIYVLGLNLVHYLSPSRNTRWFDYTMNNRGCV